MVSSRKIVFFFVCLIVLVLLPILTLLLPGFAELLIVPLGLFVEVVRVFMGLALGLFTGVYLLVGEVVKAIPAGAIEITANSFREFADRFGIGVLPTTSADLVNAMQWAFTLGIFSAASLAAVLIIIRKH